MNLGQKPALRQRQKTIEIDGIEVGIIDLVATMTGTRVYHPMSVERGLDYESDLDVEDEVAGMEKTYFQEWANEAHLKAQLKAVDEHEECEFDREEFLEQCRRDFRNGLMVEIGDKLVSAVAAEEALIVVGASLMARKGTRSKSDRKTAAARENGKKGGRPKKSVE